MSEIQKTKSISLTKKNTICESVDAIIKTPKPDHKTNFPNGLKYTKDTNSIYIDQIRKQKTFPKKGEESIEYITINQFEGVEKIEFKKMTRFLLNKNYFEYPEEYDRLMKYNATRKDGVYNSNYHIKGHGYGRLYANNSIINFSRNVKHTLLNGEYIDIDGVNMAPNIIYQFTKKYFSDEEIKKSNIEEFINDPKSLRDQIIKEYNTTKEIAKNLIHRFMYGGSICNWIKDNNLNTNSNNAQFTSKLYRIRDMFASMTRLIYDANKHIEVDIIEFREKEKNRQIINNLNGKNNEEAEDDKKHKYNTDNLQNSVVSLWIYSIERHIIETCIMSFPNFLDEMKYKDANNKPEFNEGSRHMNFDNFYKYIIYEYDGMLINKELFNNITNNIDGLTDNLIFSLSEKFCDYITNVIQTKYGIHIKFSIKDFEDKKIIDDSVFVFNEVCNRIALGDDDFRKFVSDITKGNYLWYNEANGKNKSDLCYKYNKNGYYETYGAEKDLYDYLYDNLPVYLSKQYDKIKHVYNFFSDRDHKDNMNQIAACKKKDKMTNIIELSKIYIGLPKNIQFDKDIYLIAFNNGVFDLRQNKFIKDEDILRKAYITKTTGYDYIEPSQTQIDYLKRFIKRIHPNTNIYKFVLQIFASCLCGRVMRQVYYFTGCGANGKSTLNDLMKTLLGDEFYNLFDPNLKKNGEMNASLANNHLKRFLLATEKSGLTFIDGNLIKELTMDECNIRALFSNITKIKQCMTAIFEGNNPFNLMTDSDKAMFRRLLCIPHNSLFLVDLPKEDPINHKYKADDTCQSQEWRDEYKCVMFKILSDVFYETYKENGDNFPNELKAPQEIIDYSNSMMQHSSPLTKLINENCIQTENEGDIILIEDLYDLICLKNKKQLEQQKITTATMFIEAVRKSPNYEAFISDEVKRVNKHVFTLDMSSKQITSSLESKQIQTKNYINKYILKEDLDALNNEISECMTDLNTLNICNDNGEPIKSDFINKHIVSFAYFKSNSFGGKYKLKNDTFIKNKISKCDCANSLKTDEKGTLYFEGYAPNKNIDKIICQIKDEYLNYDEDAPDL